MDFNKNKQTAKLRTSFMFPECQKPNISNSPIILLWEVARKVFGILPTKSMEPLFSVTYFTFQI